MLDALKFAFEILIVGALALPWVAVLNRMFPGRDTVRFGFDLEFVPRGARNGVEIALVVAFGYLLGSAASRFSRDFFNDEIWQPLPTEDVIRDSVYFDEYCSEQYFPYKYWLEPIHLKPLPDFCPKQKDQKGNDLPTTVPKLSSLSETQFEGFNELVQEVFRLQDSVLLLQGVDRVDRLKQYFDQINILRGAAFNGFILFALSVFGGIGQLKLHYSRYRALVPVFYLPAAATLVYMMISLWNHWYRAPHGHYSDPPLAEIVIVLLAVVGLLIAWRPERAHPDKEMPYIRICCIAAVMMVVSFGSWWWTEVMYDLQVIHSLAEINDASETKPAVDPTTGKKREFPAAKKPAAVTDLPSAAEQIKPH